MPETGWEGLCPACLVRVSLPVPAETPPPAPAPPALLSPGNPRRFGDYELLEEIGRGGMGVIFKARQVSLNRVVAVKMILAGPFASAGLVHRFRAEAEAIAQLHHPNIVAIYGFGEQEGTPFFAMEHVPGRSLGELVADKPLPAHRAARYMQILAEATHYAHEQGVLHRDLKPSNVLIDAADQPRLTDFGLAKRMDQHLGGTRTGDMLGSPSYMAPEQVEAGRGLASPGSDVFSLGAILFHLLTGRPPFLAETVEGTLLQVLTTDPVAPRRLNPRVPVDLGTICLKCLEKSPSARYATAKALAQDLGRFLAGEPIQARALTVIGRCWRWGCRRPLATASLIFALLVLVLGLSGVIWQWRRAQASAQAEARERRRAERSLYTADIILAHQALERNDLRRAVEHLHKWQPSAGRTGGQPADPEQDLRHWEWFHLWNRCRSDEQATLGAHAAQITDLAFSPDGTRLASGCVAGGVKLWDVQQQRLLAETSHRSWISALAFSAEGTQLASAGKEGGVRLWDGRSLLESGGPLMPTNNVITVQFTQDGHLITSERELLRVWDLSERTFTSAQMVDGATHDVLAPNQQWLASGKGNGRIVLTSLVGGSRRVLTGHTGTVSGLDWSLDAGWLASGSVDGTIRIWAVAEGRNVATLRGHLQSVMGVSFSPDATLLATGSQDQTLKLWDLKQPSELATLRGHTSAVVKVRFSPTGGVLASGDADGVVKLWSAAPPVREPGRLLLPSSVRRQAPASDGTALLTRSDDQWAFWDLRQLERPPRPIHLPGGVREAFLASDGAMCAGETEPGEIVIWDVPRDRELTRLQGAVSGVRGAMFSPGGQLLAVVRLEPVAELWEVDQRKLLGSSSRHAARQSCRMAFSPDSELLAWGYDDGGVELWAVQGWRRLHHWPAHPVLVTAVEFAPDGRTLATGGAEGRVKFWSVSTYGLLDTLTVSAVNIPALAFSRDGQRLAAGTGEGLVKIWDLTTRQELLALKGHGHPFIHYVGFRASGGTLVSASLTDVILWPGGPGP